MKKHHILIKEFVREVRKSYTRFLSILLITLLGVAFYSGIRAGGPDMRLSADMHFDKAKLMDVRVLSTLGLTEEDVKRLEEIPGVSYVCPSYSTDVLCRMKDSQPVIHLMAYTDKINLLTVEEGSVPKKTNEIFLDKDLMQTYGLKIGDHISFSAGEKNGDISDTLKETEYTIVGSGSSPFYLSLDRGTSTIGNGTVAGFGVIPQKSFSMEAYSEIYLSVKDADKENCYEDAYTDVVDVVKEEIEDISDEQCQIRYASVMADGQEGIDEAKAEIQDAQQELKDAEEKLEDGKKKLEDGKKNLIENAEKLEDGETEIQEKTATLESGKTQITAAKKELAVQKNTLNQGKASLASAKTMFAQKEQELIAGEQQLTAGEQKIAEGEQQLAAGELQLTAGKEELEAKRQELEAQRPLVEEGKEQLPQLSDQLVLLNEELAPYEKQLQELSDQLTLLLEQKELLEQTIQELEAQIKALEEGNQPPDETILEQIEQLKQELAIQTAALKDLETFQKQMEEGIQQLEENMAEPLAKKAQLEAAIQKIQKGIEQFENGLAKITEGEEKLAQKEAAFNEAKADFIQSKAVLEQLKAQLTVGRQQLTAGKQKLAASEASLAAGEAQLRQAEILLSSKENQLAEGERQLEKARQKLLDGKKELAEAKITLLEKEEELTEAEETFLKESKKAQKEIQDAKEQIAEAEEELAKLKVPTWYVLGRDSIQTYVEYGQDTERIEAIGKVFPAIFFLVAALICLTTMTRMVEENRTQIGTLKALGYGKRTIASKYLFYALTASLVGSLIGLFFGQSFLPIIIINAYRILYNNLSVAVAPIYAGYSISSTALAVGITVLAAGFACYKEMAEVPAQLMRPEAPKNGKRIFLERITFLWKHLSFSNKATCRNLFRYKKRFFMTVLGIGGCMGLLMVGFGLKDSIMAIGEKQFDEIQIYSGSINLDSDIEKETKDQVLRKIANDPEVEEYMEALETSLDVGYQGVERSSYMVVVSDLEKLPHFVDLRDRKTQKPYVLNDDGVIITEKLAKLLEVSAGDTIYLKDGDTKQMEVKVTAVVENYFFHYVYMTPKTYESLYGETPEYTEVFVRNIEETPEFEESFQSRYMKENGVLNVSFLSSIGERIDNMLTSMDAVIWIIVIAAGMLAFVVLYNLNNINISERRRELATLKVLGFYEMEVSQYVFRENVILTFLGTLVGIFFGILLHRFVILTAEIDLMMFGRDIKFRSYFYSICLTLLFSFLVNLFMHFKLKKLDMVESMKSVE